MSSFSWARSVCVWTLLLLFALPVAAQEKTTLTAEQIKLNNQAILLLRESPPQTKKAIDLVQAALLMGSTADLLHLTLGRAFQVDGQCEQAVAQFELSETAPEAQGLPRAFVSVQRKKYAQELLTQCPGTLVVTCSDPKLELTLGDTSLTCNTPLTLQAGEYTVQARNPSTQAALSLKTNITGTRQTKLAVDLGKVEEKKKDVVEPSPKGTPKATGFASLTLPGGLCLARVTRDDQGGGAATSASICGGARVEAGFLFPLSSSLSLSTQLFAQGLGSGSLGLTQGEAVTLQGADFGASVALWINPIVGLDATLRTHIHSISLENETAITPVGSTLVFQAGPGINARLGSLLPALERLDLYARWMLWTDGFSTSNFNVGVLTQIGGFTLGLEYLSWLGGVTADPSFGLDEGASLDHGAEQILLHIGWTFDFTL